MRKTIGWLARQLNVMGPQDSVPFFFLFFFPPTPTITMRVINWLFCFNAVLAASLAAPRQHSLKLSPNMFLRTTLPCLLNSCVPKQLNLAEMNLKIHARLHSLRQRRPLQLFNQLRSWGLLSRLLNISLLPLCSHCHWLVCGKESVYV